MSKINDGGPAFGGYDECGDPVSEMSLRDWFAGKALAGLIVGYAQTYGSPTREVSEMTVEAYGVADAMLAARNPRHD